MPKPVKFGRKTRMSYSKINEVTEIPNLIQIQTESYNWFLEKGLKEVFEDVSPMEDYAGNLALEFVGHSLSDPPKWGEEECKDRDSTYAVPLKVKVRLINKETGEVKEQEVFMGDFPLMTDKGTFIYNGAERVVVTQLVRSPGPYYDMSIDKSNKKLYSTTVIPNRGAWLEYETDSNEVISVRIDRTRKQPATTLVRAMGALTALQKEKKIEEIIFMIFGKLEQANEARKENKLTKEKIEEINIEGIVENFRLAVKPDAYKSKLINRALSDGTIDRIIEDFRKASKTDEGLDYLFDVFQVAGEVAAKKTKQETARFDIGNNPQYEIARKIAELYIEINDLDMSLSELVKEIKEGTNEEILEVLGEDFRLLKTLDKDTTKTGEEGLKEIYRKQRPGEPPTLESAKGLLESMFFDAKRYDLAKVGRYKYNKKLGLSNRIIGCKAAEDVYDPMTGEVLVSNGDFITRELGFAIENRGVESVWVKGKFDEEQKTKVIGNNFVELKQFVKLGDDEGKYPEKVLFPVLKKILNNTKKKDLLEEILKNKNRLSPKHITMEDILASFSYVLNLNYGVGNIDDIDHLGNRRLRTVGELLQNQFRIGLSRMERTVRERMTTQDIEVVTPQALMNTRPVTAAIKEFFGSSQLSQFMDQTNPLVELTHKRRLSALGPGGLTRERAGFDVRDVHYSHYGRMCPIETPEGPNIGLIGSLTTYGRVNEYGFIETPYRLVEKGEGRVTNKIEYLTADEEEMLIIAQANEPLDAKGYFVNEKVASQGAGGEIDLVHKNLIDYMDVSPKQVVSVATAMIPFLENDDANRALMGSNMQRQAVPLMVTEAPIVATGIEHKAACDSGVVVLAKNSGRVNYVDAEKIVVNREDGEGEDTYNLLKFRRSNQGTCINQQPIVYQGEKVEKGEVIADGPSTSNGEIALGKNLLVGFMTWEGYNYEDAIILNERLIMDDDLTSIHIEEYEVEARDTKLGPEEISRDIPGVATESLKDLDEEGIVRIGAEVTSLDILVGKTTPKGETEPTAEEKLLRAIFGEKSREVRDTSLKVPHGETGIVVEVRVFSKENGDELSPGVNKLVRVYVATKRKVSVGDKMAGRHGNKGVISRILPEEDMPFMDDGVPLEVMLNPLGVPSRMNVGQILEVHLGLVAKKKDWYISTPVFDGADEKEILDLLEDSGFSRTGKVSLRDGRTGETFDNPVTVGYMYMMKLHHLVDDKIHARSTGPYSLVTQQPLGGKAQFGGQRFGEMEVWALEAYGAAYTLQEILTVKSDDISGRLKTYEAIVRGDNIPEAGIPESFKVLIKEMQSLGLDVKVLSDNEEEIEIKESSELENLPEFKGDPREIQSFEEPPLEDEETEASPEEE